MAESKIPDINERNAELFKEIEEMDVGETKIFDSSEHRIMDYLRAIQYRYTAKRKGPAIDFKLTLCTGSLIILRIA